VHYPDAPSKVRSTETLRIGEVRVLEETGCPRMDKLTKSTGLAATTAWLLLSILTAGSGVLDPNTIVVNMVVALIFLGVSLLLLWRVNSMDAARRSMPRNEAMRSLLHVETVSAAAMFLLGVTLLIAAGSRVFREGMPVFG
jgi:hypothetical protein